MNIGTSECRRMSLPLFTLTAPEEIPNMQKKLGMPFILFSAGERRNSFYFFTAIDFIKTFKIISISINSKC